MIPYPHLENKKGLSVNRHKWYVPEKWSGQTNKKSSIIINNNSKRVKEKKMLLPNTINLATNDRMKYEYWYNLYLWKIAIYFYTKHRYYLQIFLAQKLIYLFITILNCVLVEDAKSSEIGYYKK